MSRAGSKGMLIGAVMGFAIAYATWTGDTAQAAYHLIVSAAIGWFVGYQIGKNRRA